ncbi:MAG: 30S ribosomal protein S7 [Nitrospinota bacterium]
MSRRRVVIKKRLVIDQKYSDPVVGKLIRILMLDGKKGVAERMLYDCFDLIHEKKGEDPMRVFVKAVDNIRPMVEVKPRRVGGATYQIPIDVRPERRQALALRWLVKYSRARKERTMKERLAGELMDAFSGAGAAVKKREETHKMAEANRAFAHFRW